MTKLFMVSRSTRERFKKVLALFMTISINLSLGGAAALLPTSVAYAAPVGLFGDGFEATTPFLNWNIHNSDWVVINNAGSAQSGSKRASVTGPSSNEELQKQLSTVGYTDIGIDFWYKADQSLESGDNVKLQWSNNSGVSWTDAFTISSSNDNSSWTHATVSLPSGANNSANFRVRFLANTNSSSDQVSIDNFNVSGSADITPPDTTITSGPTGTVSTNSATLSFTSTESGSTFTCKLDNNATESCTSPKSYVGLSWGEHTFSVFATDPAGNSDQTPASRTWTPARPDLTVTKTHEGDAYVNGTFQWKLHVANIGNANAKFDKDDEILIDNMPNSDVSDYDAPSITNATGVTIVGSISCTQTGSKKEDLTCKVSHGSHDSVTIAPNGSFDVVVNVHPTSVGTLANPRVVGHTTLKCGVDKYYSSGDAITESNEDNNSCADSVSVENPHSTLVVIKHVDGGPMSAENFILHVNGGDGFSGSETGTVFTSTENPFNYAVTEDTAGDYVSTFDNCDSSIVPGGSATCTVTNHYDLCLNMEGYQSEVPAGYERSGGNCFPVVTDVCPNLEGVQSTVPDGYELVEGQCVVPETNSCDTEILSLSLTSSDPVQVGTVDGPDAVPVDINLDAEGNQIHTAWTASIPGATWIWGENPPSDTVNDLTETFYKTFTVNGDAEDMTLDVAADNSYKVWLNDMSGDPLFADASENNFGVADSYTITADKFVTGENVLKFEVTNKHLAGGTPQTNPAGLMFKLAGDYCVAPEEPAPVCDPEVNLIDNGSFESPVVDNSAKWDTFPDTNALLKWLVDYVTPNTDSDASHKGLEVQRGVAGTPSDGDQLAELDGYHPMTIWQNITTIPGKEYALSFDFSPRPHTAASENILRVMKDDVALDADLTADGTSNANTAWTPHTYTFVATGNTTKIGFADMGNDDNGNNGGVGTYLDNVTLSCKGDPKPKATVVATKIICDNESDLPNWSGTHHEINASTAEDYVSESEGSCHIDPNWKFQWAPTSAGNPGDNTGEAGGNWTTFVSSAVIELGDMTNVWIREVYDDAYIPFTGTSDTDTVSAELYCNGDVLHYDNLDYANGLSNGATVYCVAFNVLKSTDTTTCEEGQHFDGESCVNDTPVCEQGEHFDGESCVSDTPVCDEGQHYNGEECVDDTPPVTPPGGGGGSTNYDYWGCTNVNATNFNPLANKDDGSCDVPGGSGGNEGTTTDNGGGEVLGASTTTPDLSLPESCTPYLTTFMKMGKPNDVDDVKRLQTFLNEEMSAGLPVTGFFGIMTKKWVKAFQVAHHDEIFAPWIAAGYDASEFEGGTGVVYKTTRRAINIMKCDALDIPIPDLHGDPGLI